MYLIPVYMVHVLMQLVHICAHATVATQIPNALQKLMNACRIRVIMACASTAYFRTSVLVTKGTQELTAQLK